MNAHSNDFPRNFIRAWRRYRGLTQAELAAAINLDRTYVNKVERGRRGVVPQVLDAMAQALECDSRDLIGRHPSYTSDLETFCMSLNPDEQSMALKMLKAAFRR